MRTRIRSDALDNGNISSDLFDGTRETGAPAVRKPLAADGKRDFKKSQSVLREGRLPLLLSPLTYVL